MSEQTGGRIDRAYRLDIDGLRSIAILSVVLFHAGLPFISGGFTGVDIFFVISGYLIGGRIYSDLRQGTFSYLTFYQRRAKRILPALFVVVAFLLLFGLFLFSPFEMRRLSEYVCATMASASNILFWMKVAYFDLHAENNPLLMTWSLGLEEQFYILIPLLMVLIFRLRRDMILASIGIVIGVSFGFAWYQLRPYPMADFYLLPTRAWELAVGVGLAIYEFKRKPFHLRIQKLALNALSCLGVALILLPFGLITPSTPFPGPTALPTVAGSALIISTNRSWINSKVLALSPLVFIGRISYSWYLWHWPILAIIRTLRGGSLPPSLGAIAVIASLGVAIASFYLIEQPFRLSKRSASPLLIRYGLISLLLLAGSFAIFTTRGIERRFPILASIDKAKLDFQSDTCMALSGESKPHFSSPCATHLTSMDKLALWGDSHAAALAPALRSRAFEKHYLMEEYAKTSCPPLLGAARTDPYRPQHAQECIAYNNQVFERLKEDPNIKVVALEAAWAAPFDASATADQMVSDEFPPLIRNDQQRSAKILEESLRRTALELRQIGKVVVIFGDVPSFKLDPLWRMRTGRIPGREVLLRILAGGAAPVDPGYSRAKDAEPRKARIRELVKRTALSIPGVIFWDLRDQMCDANDACLYRAGDVPYYVDENHLSSQGGFKALNGWSVPVAHSRF